MSVLSFGKFCHVLLSGALLLGIWCAQAEDSPRPTYKVVTEGSFPPFEFYNEAHELTGFDIDLIRALGEEMDFAVEFCDVPFTEVLPALDRGEADIAIAAIAITPGRQARYAFSDRYHTGGQRLAVRRELLGRVHDLSDVIAEPVCVEAGSNGHDLLLALRHRHIITCTSNHVCNELFNAGTCRIMIRNGDVTRYNIKTGELTDATLTPLEITHNELGIAVRQNDRTLLNRIDAGLRRLNRNGTLENLEARWFPSPEPPPHH